MSGSAHCLLGPYWQGSLGKSTLKAYQASARGGYVRLREDDDQVRAGGQALTVMRGRLV
ncbi:MAG: PhzF family phenazine biosynthesis protein [Candidatus Hydrogenedentes bacterium]|nr:PhzF family phenazine biosynthesis protein [Candidatus Hydrogenedentota bacterium]